MFVVNWCNIDEMKWHKLNKWHEFYNFNNLYMIHSLVLPFQNKIIKKKIVCLSCFFCPKTKFENNSKTKKEKIYILMVQANLRLKFWKCAICRRITFLHGTRNNFGNFQCHLSSQQPHMALWHLLQISAVLFLMPLFFFFLWKIGGPIFPNRDSPSPSFLFPVFFKYKRLMKAFRLATIMHYELPPVGLSHWSALAFLGQ